VAVRFTEIKRIDADECEIRVRCSKGTYIRTLAHDIGQRLGCGAVLTKLRRLRCGDFTLDGAVTISNLRVSQEKPKVMPTDMLFEKYERLEVESRDEVKIKNGRAVFAPESTSTGEFFRVYSESGEFLMLAKSVKEGERAALQCVKSFFEV